MVCAGSAGGPEQSDPGKRLDRGVESDDAPGAANGYKDEAVGKESADRIIWGSRTKSFTVFDDPRRSDRRILFSLAGGNQIQGLLHRPAFNHDFVLQQRDGIDQLLRTRRT